MLLAHRTDIFGVHGDLLMKNIWIIRPFTIIGLIALVLAMIISVSVY